MFRRFASAYHSLKGVRKANTFPRRVLSVLLLVAAAQFNSFAQQPEKPVRQEVQLPQIPDRRRVVADTSKFPYSAVVKIIATYPDGTKGEGSGALIGPDQVVTADHVVHNADFGGDATSIEVLPGYDDNYTSCKRTTAKSWRHSSHHGCHDGAKCDIAILTLREELGCDTGWFGFKQYSNDDLSQVFIAGYPADLDNGQKMYVAKTKASIVQNSNHHNVLRYYDWTYSGMSGGPIFTSDYYIVGIHTDGGSEANYGIAFCNNLFTQIKRWSKE